MREVLRRGIDAGELRADLDVEVAMAMLIGPMLMQRVLQLEPRPGRATLPERVVDAVAGRHPAR